MILQAYQPDMKEYQYDRKENMFEFLNTIV